MNEKNGLHSNIDRPWMRKMDFIVILTALEWENGLHSILTALEWEYWHHITGNIGALQSEKGTPCLDH